MKKFIVPVLLLAACSIVARSANYTIRWLQNDPSDEVAVYKVWSIKGNNTNLIVTVPHITGSVSNQTPGIDLKGNQTIFITAVNPGGEGPPSTNLTFFAKPNAVTGLSKTP